MSMTKMTATGVKSLVGHVRIETHATTGRTVVTCGRCGEWLSQEFPGSVHEIDEWMQAHTSCVSERPHDWPTGYVAAEDEDAADVT